MKVSKDEEFTPITIVLETEEEADLFWHKYNNTKFTDGYLSSYPKFSKINWITLRSRSLEKFNKVHRPKEVRDVYGY